jgi:hypothetical protein
MVDPARVTRARYRRTADAEPNTEGGDVSDVTAREEGVTREEGSPVAGWSVTKP